MAILATQGGRKESFLALFRMGVGESAEAHEIPDDLFRNDSERCDSPPTMCGRNSPKSLSLVG